MYFVDACHAGRHRRDYGLGARALSQGRARPGLFRWHRALRARRSAPGRASRLGHADLQFRPQRSARVPDRERAVLAEADITSTGCAWMPWPPCSISTTRARKASGFRIASAGARIWKPSNSCGASTNWRMPCPGAFTIAEESTAFPGVSRPVYAGGLGFTMKWNMGWMHDMLHYFGEDPVHRKYHHNNITFSMLYAFTENFVLPISHDEVVYGKGSLLGKMPGDEWQKFANVRAFLAYMYAHPGKKLLFMGSDIGDLRRMGSRRQACRGICCAIPIHAGLRAYVRELNRLYRAKPALYQVDFEYTGFEWIDFSDVDQSSISFLRRARGPGRLHRLRLQLHAGAARGITRSACRKPGYYQEILNTDAAMFGGSNCGNAGGVHVGRINRSHGRPSHDLGNSAAAGRGGFPQMRRRTPTSAAEPQSDQDPLRRHHHRRRPQRPGHGGLSGARGQKRPGAGAPRDARRLRGHRRALARLPRLHRRLSRQPAAGAHRPRTGTGALRLSGHCRRTPRSSPSIPTAGICSSGRTNRRRWPEIAKFSARDAEAFPKYEAYLERLARSRRVAAAGHAAGTAAEEARAISSNT